MKKFNIIVLTTILFSSMVLSSCSKGEKKETFNLFNWTYYTPDSVLEKFEKEYNCIVKTDYFDSNEVMYSKLRAGAKGYDLTIPSSDAVNNKGEDSGILGFNKDRDGKGGWTEKDLSPDGKLIRKILRNEIK